VMGFTKDDKLNEDKAIKKFFAPEFRNRLDATVNFRALSLEVVTQVVSKFIADLEEQISSKNITITLTLKAKKELARLGYDKLMGARPLNRVIAQHIKNKLTDAILFGALKNGGEVYVDFVEDTFQFEYKKIK
ncbi:MAG: ATP-dependent Clp protease ATP-binding subunit ClpA, partial [Arcobacteraceae bacterium]